MELRGRLLGCTTERRRWFLRGDFGSQDVDFFKKQDEFENGLCYVCRKIFNPIIFLLDSGCFDDCIGPQVRLRLLSNAFAMDMSERSFDWHFDNRLSEKTSSEKLRKGISRLSFCNSMWDEATRQRHTALVDSPDSL